MFERFDDAARKAMALANQEAQRTGDDFIRPEHLLIGIVQTGDSVGARTLRLLNVDLESARREQALLVAAPAPPTKKVIELAIEESAAFGHTHVGTEHMLLALLREVDGPAVQILGALGLSADEVRRAVLGLLEQG